MKTTKLYGMCACEGNNNVERAIQVPKVDNNNAEHIGWAWVTFGKMATLLN